MNTQQVSKNGVVLTSHSCNVYTVELATKDGTLQLELESTSFSLAHATYALWASLRTKFEF